MDSLINKLLEELTRRACRISIIEDVDGFLARPDTIKALKEQAQVTVKTVSQLELRVLFETEYRGKDGDRVWFLMEKPSEVLADISTECYVCKFSVRDLLASFHQQRVDTAKITYQMLARLYDNRTIRQLNSYQTSTALKEAERLFGEDGDAIQILKENLMGEVVDWSHTHKAIATISEYVVRAAKQGEYEGLNDELAFFNNSFQKYLAQNYNVLKTSSAPRVVNKILPHIAQSYGFNDKVALVVVDGMAYWQYLILKEYMDGMDVSVQEGVSIAWLPSITQLSRQAIFRGGMPLREYRQNPTNEKKLWNEFWKSRNFPDTRIQYLDNLKAEISEMTTRLACVDMTVDERMHSAHSMKILYQETCEWAEGFVAFIKRLLALDFLIVITADHGSVPSNPWRSLKQAEKTWLFDSNSRGKRHLIYQHPDAMRDFVESNAEMKDEWLVKDDYVVWMTNRCFDDEYAITHGGSHMLEMVVPLIKISNR